MEIIEILINLAPTIITVGIGILAGAGGYYLIAKNKLHQFRHFIDSIDNAVIDDAVTEEEFREVYDTAKELIRK